MGSDGATLKGAVVAAREGRACEWVRSRSSSSSWRDAVDVGLDASEANKVGAAASGHSSWSKRVIQRQPVRRLAGDDTSARTP